MALREEEVPQIIKTSNSETFKSLPTEMILEILLRLPVESLLRCKSVCKFWFSLISDPHFVKSHLKLSTTSSIINNDYVHHQLFWTTKRIYRLIKSCPLNDVLFARSVVRSLHHAYTLSYPHYDRLRIVDSCNGLLFIVVDNATLCICNPTTRMWNRLPYCGFEKQIVGYGFGYDNLTDDYKVVGISRFQGKPASKIFSLKSAKWKNIDDGIPRGIKLRRHHGKFSNGAIHWAARDYKSSGDFAIVSFDLAKETYGQVSQPVYDDGDHKNFKLGVLGEWLCVLCNYRGNRADVWVMKVYGVKDSWTKLVSIPYLTTQPTLSDLISVPLFISNDGKLLLRLGMGELVVYDSKNNSFSEIQNLGACPQVCTFVESLVSPKTVAGLADNNVDENLPPLL